jgi:protoporphyrinogen oxidase
MYDVIIVGAGFTGLTTALELTRSGRRVLVLERDETPGGLAGTFQFRDGVTIEKFYHHWFNNDAYVPLLVRTLDLEGDILTLPSTTGMFYGGRFWRLSSPVDLLKFKPLGFLDRLRLGLLVARVRMVRDWRNIENLSIREWLEPLCGHDVYQIVWAPLVESKFSVFAEDVNAVWMWKKLVLRGGTRGRGGREELRYFRGGFGRLAQAIVDHIQKHGGEVRFRQQVSSALCEGNTVTGLKLASGSVVQGRQFLFTPAFPIIADLFADSGQDDWLSRLRRVNYLGNICLVLELDRSLSNTYWLNVNDPGFPFVGVIEHTNLDSSDHYGGNRIVYLSRYLARQDPVWRMDAEAYVDFAVGHLRRMFPDFERTWLCDYRIWRAEYAQPVTERLYSKYCPKEDTPFSNARISTMAQVYPEDRGTNYAIREGLSAARAIELRLQGTPATSKSRGTALFR